MKKSRSPHHVMALFTTQGERKYLNEAERKRFYNALPTIEEQSERTFCETIYWTGCRISEALQLEIARVDIDGASIVFRTLKKHGKQKGQHFRTVPVPRDFVQRLNRVHGIRREQQCSQANVFARIWCFGRQKGWRLIKTVMAEAKVFGARATARGLRHTFGVHAILSGVPETILQKWFGHASLDTTAVYVAVTGIEDRTIAKRMWG